MVATRTQKHKDFSLLKGTVSRELRWVLLNRYQLKALFKCYWRPSQNLNFIKGTIHSQHKKIQRMNGPTILDGLTNSRWSDQF